MARVYHARDQRTGGDLALKIDDPDMAMLNPPSPFTWLEREAEVLRHLRHGNIVRLHGDGYTKWVGLALEHLPVSYRYVCEDASYVRLTKYLIDIASGLSHLHERGIVHRDVKPSNTCGREEGGEVIFRLIDFNLATTANPDYRPQADDNWGTPMYRPSRKEMMRHGITPTIDTYSLGKTIATIVFEMQERNSQKINRLLERSDERVLLALAKNGIPDRLYALTQDCLAPDPRQRPAAIEIIERSFELLDNLTLPAFR